MERHDSSIEWKSIDHALNYEIDIKHLKSHMSGNLRDMFETYWELFENQGILKSSPSLARVFGFFIILSQLFSDITYNYGGTTLSSINLSMLYIANSGESKSKLFEQIVGLYAYSKHNLDYQAMTNFRLHTNKDYNFVTNIPTLKQVTGGNIYVPGKKNEKIKKWMPGALESKSFTIFEEFSQVLCGKTSDSHNILMQLHTAMDRPGHIDAHGISNYRKNDKGTDSQSVIRVNTSLLMASTIYSDFYKEDLLRSGFYRRPLFVCSIQYSDNYNKRLEGFLNKLPKIDQNSIQDYNSLLKNYMDNFKNKYLHVKNINQSKIIDYNGEIWYNHFGPNLYREYEYFLNHSSFNDSQREYLNHIKENPHINLTSIAVLCAYVSGRTECNHDDFQIAYELVRNSFLNAIKFILHRDLYRKNTHENKDLSNTEIKLIRDLIEKNANIQHPKYGSQYLCIDQNSLLGLIHQKKKQGKWQFGKNITIQKLHSAVRQNNIQSTVYHDNLQLPYNRKYFYLKEDKKKV